MARANKLDPCMFCGNTPCTCNGPAKKPKASPNIPRQESKPSRPAPKPDLKAAMRRKSQQAKPEPQKMQVRVQEREVPAYDDDFSNALRALKPILHREEWAKYRDILVNPATRAAAWKKRNRHE